MAARKALEAALTELRALRDDPSAPQALAKLRSALAGRSSHLAAVAAEIAAAHELADLSADLAGAFDRFLHDPVRTDPSCAAKQAIADALYRIGAPELPLYLRGIHHVQMEPVWGGKADTATGLRATCALALVRIHYHDYLNELAELLADVEAPARRAAAQALAYSENPAAAPLLRLKALSGDADAQVVGECLLALLRVTPSDALPFVARFLDRADAEVADAAALALGSSRLPAALQHLTAWWERTFDRERRRSALLAIALLKSDAAIAYLLAHIADSAPPHAVDAINALAVYRHDLRLRAQLAAAIEAREEVEVRAEFSKVWGALGNS
jgi:hypothetical protein